MEISNASALYISNICKYINIQLYKKEKKQINSEKHSNNENNKNLCGAKPLSNKLSHLSPLMGC